MTLNDLERRESLYFAFFSPNSTDFQADYITVVEDRPIMSIKYCFPVFLANVNSCSCSLYVVVGPSVVCLSSVVCNVRVPYSGD